MPDNVRAQDGINTTPTIKYFELLLGILVQALIYSFPKPILAEQNHSVRRLFTGLAVAARIAE